MRAMLIGLVLLPALASGQGVVRTRPNYEQLIVTRHIAAPAGAGTAVQSILLPRPLFVTTVATWVYGASGGGAGSTTVRVTDGTNNCDCSITCVASQSLGPKRASCTGTCTFAAGASVSFNVQTAGCTTTQPSVMSLDVRGTWL